MPTPLPGGTVFRKFTTRVVTTGVPTTLAGSPVVSIYKDGSTAESVTGVTLTVDFDARTGLNHVAIDTSADGTFYATGSIFYLVITTGTVGGTSVVGEVVGEFELGYLAVDVEQINGKTVTAASAITANANLGTTQPVNFTGTAGSALVKSDAVDLGGTAFASAVVLARLADSVTHGGAAAILSLAQITVTATSDNSAFVLRGNGTGSGFDVQGGATGRGFDIAGGGTSGAAVAFGAVNGEAFRLHGGNGTGAAAVSIGCNSSTDANAFTINADGSGAALALTGGATGDALELLGGSTSGFAIFAQSHGRDCARFVVQSGNGDGISGIGSGTGVGFRSAATAVGFGGASAATVAAAVWDEINTGATHNLKNSTGKQLRSITVGTNEVIYTATAPSQAGMTSTQIKLDSGASSVDNTYRFDVVSIITGTGAGQSRFIPSYVGSTKIASVSLAWTTQPDNTSVFEITPTPQAQVIGTADANIVSSAINVPAILADGVAHGGTPGSSTATLAMGHINVQNANGDAVFFASNGGANAHGLNIRGSDDGQGSGLYVRGGAGAHGIDAGGNGAGAGILAAGGTVGTGMSLVSSSTYGLDVSGVEAGIHVRGSSGPGIDTQGGGSYGPGIQTYGINAPGIDSEGGTDQPGIYCSGNGAGSGIQADAGATGKGMLLTAAAATDSLAIAAGGGTPTDIFDAEGRVLVRIPGL